MKSNDSFNILSIFRRESQYLERILMLILILEANVCLIANAQKVGGLTGNIVGSRIPDAQTSKAAKDRAELFLRDVAALAPSLPTNEPNRLQAWPRSPYNLSRIFGTHDTEKKPREKGGTVIDDNEFDPVIHGKSWKVEYYIHDLSVNVSQQNNMVIGYFDSGFISAVSTEEAPTLDQCISQETAITRSAAYLRAAGLDLNTIAIDQVKFAETHSPPQGGDRKWMVYFKRIWNGIPYSDQGAMLFLEAGAGRLICMAIRTAADAPRDVRVEIPASYALQVLDQNLKQSNARLFGTPIISLGVTLPNDSEQTLKNRIPTFSSHSRLSWVIWSQITGSQVNNNYVEAWVDAITGETIRYNIIGSRGKSPLPSPLDKTLADLHASKHIEIQKITKEGVAVGDPTVLDAKKDVVRFYAGMSGIHQGYPAPNGKPMPFTATHLLTITLANGKKELLRYDSGSYQIAPENGKPEERLQAGPGMQAWIGSLLSDRLTQKKK